MSVRYPCDQCGKDFNFRIKLNRHIAIVHRQPDRSSSDDFLQPGAVLNDEDKVKHFDALRIKFQELSSKVSNSEKRFEYHLTKLKALEKTKSKSKNKFKNSKQSKPKFVGAANSSGSFEDINNDITIPVGWKSAFKLMPESFGKDCKIKVFWAPNGRFFYSRRQAMHYMISELESTPSDLELMRKGFSDEGWLEDEKNLPKGWICKFNTDHKLFLTEDYSLLKGQRKVLKYMAVKNSDDDIGSFLCKYYFKNQIDLSGIRWMVSGDIPFPWRVANLTYKSGAKSQVIISPYGQLFSCLKSFVDFINKWGEMEKKNIEAFVNFLGNSIYEEKLAENDWVPDEALPKGWRKMKKVEERYTRYLSPSGETFATRQAAIEHLRTMGVEIQTLEKVKKEKVPKAIHVEKQQVNWQIDELIPENWRIGLIEGAEVKKYKDPKGAVFRDRTEAIRNMLKDPGCSDSDVSMMKAGLIKDGWAVADFLPSGWMMQSRKRMNRNATSRCTYTVYLSPECEVLQAFESVYQHLKTLGCSDDELLIFKEQCPYKWKSGDFLPDGWMYSVVTMGNGCGKTFHVYLSPNGRYFSALIPILSYYRDNFERSSDKAKFLALMFGNGWFTTEYLPSGWLCKAHNDKGGMMYLSPDYTRVKNTKQLIKFMQNQNIDPRIITSFRKNWKNLMSESCQKEKSENTKECNKQQSENTKEYNKQQNNDEQTSYGLSWTYDENLPQGWKMSISEILKGPLRGRKCYRFLTKNGDLYGNRAEAFKALVSDADTVVEEINRFKKGFTQEGWLPKKFMPGNWLVREQSHGSSYMSHVGDVLTSAELALHYMIENEYTPEEVDLFKDSECPSVIKRKRTIKQEYNAQKDDTKRAKILELLPNVTVSKFKQEKSEFQNKLDNKLNESKSTLEEKVKKIPKISRDWKDDETLPFGWKSALRESDLGSIKDMKIKLYLSPDERIFGSRPQSLRYMATNPCFSDNDIEDMKRGLSEEGWLVKDFLPTGWMLKVFNHGNCIVLTNTFETFKSIRKVCSFMELKNFQKDEIEKMKDGITLALKGIRPRGHRDIERRGYLVTEISDKQQKRKMRDSEDHNTAPNGNQPKTKIFKFDETLPDGWKIQNERIISTKGTAFKSRAAALKFMQKNPEMYTSKDIEEIKSKLQYEYWEDHSLIPEGWKLKKIEGGAVFFLSEIGAFIRTIRGARENIKKRNSDQELNNFDVLMDLLKPTNRGNMGEHRKPIGLVNTLAMKYEDVKTEKVRNETMDITKRFTNVKKETHSKDQNFLPVGWTENISPNSDEIVYTSPEGKTFTTRQALVEFLVKSKSDPQTIYTLWNTLGAEGWMMGDELVPPGWRMKRYKNLFDYKYLTRDMKVVNSSEEAMKYITESDDYTKDNQQHFKKWYSEVQNVAPQIVWKNDKSLPNGWKLSSGPEFEVIRDNNGALFDSRKEAIDHMIKEHYSPSNIFSLWNTLHLEGWINDEDHLPTGWKRKFYPEKKTYRYLSPMMEVVKSGETLLNIVKAGKEYNEKEVEKIQLWLKKD